MRGFFFSKFSDYLPEFSDEPKTRMSKLSGAPRSDVTNVVRIRTSSEDMVGRSKHFLQVLIQQLYIVSLVLFSVRGVLTKELLGRKNPLTRNIALKIMIGQVTLLEASVTSCD